MMDQSIEIAKTQSRFLSRTLNSRPWLLPVLKAGLNVPLERKGIEAFVATRQITPETLRQTLRELRVWAFCHIMVRDLTGVASLTEVMESMTLLAEYCICLAHDTLLPTMVERFGAPKQSDGGMQELLIIGMGKLGGRELNVSSDIDLIFIYPEEGDTRTTQAGQRSISHFEFFERLGKQIIQTLSEITEHGFVFRVDMRLRPNGDSGPLVMNFNMLEHYFVTQGREWERYAWIKARVIRGSRQTELERIVHPFVFRKYLDYGAFNAMRDLHTQIRREVAKRDREHNIKLGPGGIREIEFIAQVFQLIRGGREPGLQIRPTCEVLERLGERHILSTDTVDALLAAYIFLRRLEHRLQYIEDAQTHDLPTSPEDQQNIAHNLGFSDWAHLHTELSAHCNMVSTQFNAVFGNPCESEHDLAALWHEAATPGQIAPILTGLGYAHAEETAEQLCSRRKSSRYQQLAPNIRQRLDALVPRLIETAASQNNPDATLHRSLMLMDTICRRGAYLALLQQYPDALRRVADLVSASSWAAHFLARHPLLLDDLLDSDTLQTEPDIAAFSSTLHRALAHAAPDAERQMDLARELHHSQVFRLLIQDLAGHLTVEKLGDYLSLLADTVLDEVMQAAWRHMTAAHREKPLFAIIAYGKLGGKELGYASDLDLVYLSDDPAPESAQNYSRLAQRLSTWLSASTAAGTLFEVDLRLRPDGEAGLIVTDLEGFRRYQLEKAWVWEHQALTRARFVAGDKQIGQTFEAIRVEVLRQKRDCRLLGKEVVAMREKMRAAHTDKGSGFNLKHDAGGLIDVEFAVQYLVLGYSKPFPELTQNLGNIALLGMAAHRGLIPEALAQAAANAYRSLRAHQHRLRLNELGKTLPPDLVQTERAAVQALWSHLFGNGLVLQS